VHQGPDRVCALDEPSHALGDRDRDRVAELSENAEIVEDYKRTGGGYIYRTSAYSFVVGGYRRGAPTSLIRIRRDMDDPVVTAYFQRLDS
jgi:hypothetical protein